MKTIIKNKFAKVTLFKDLTFGQWFYSPKYPLIMCCRISSEMTNAKSSYNVLCIGSSGTFLENAEPDEEVIKIDSLEITAK